MSSTQLYPEVIDATQLGARFSQPLYLPIGVEGQGGAAATGTIGQVYTISRASDADDKFGVASPLTNLVRFVLSRGVSPIKAVMSVKGTTAPTEAEREAAWSALESDEAIRIRLTDSTTQSDLVAMADSAEQADQLYNKQISIMGMATGADKTALVAAATAIASKRAVLVGPGIYDSNGTLLSGAFSAAAVACEVAKNADIADDLDTFVIPGFLGIEKDAQGNPMFRRKVVTGTVVNEFEDLLDGGVSPLQQPPAGGIAITHLRMTFTTDSTFDALMTRLIVDQLFIDVRDYLRSNNYLRRGNTQRTRDDIRAGVQALLAERGAWVLPKVQADGTTGYNVGVTSSPDNRQVIVSYEGILVRGIQTILIAASLEIAV
jgi:hypothetical protein